MLRFWVLFGALAGVAACSADSRPAVPPAAFVDVAAISAGAEPRPADGLSATGQPDAAALARFAEAGYVAVVDLRLPDEDRGLDDEESTVEALGMDYAPFPVAGPDDISFESARRLDKLLEDFDGPVLLHCASGNRVGALLALRESLHGADDETALEYGRNAGLTRLEGRVRAVLGDD